MVSLYQPQFHGRKLGQRRWFLDPFPLVQGSDVALPTVNLLAAYLFNEGSGTTAHDLSVNGYNGTLGSGGGTAPTWTSQGLSFNGSNSVAIPVPIASVQTAHFLILPTDTGIAAQQTICGSTSAAGLNYGLDSTLSTRSGTNLQALPSPVIGSAPSTYITAVCDYIFWGQCAVLSVVHGDPNNSGNDRVYWNGVPVNLASPPAAPLDGNSSNQLRVGNLVIGFSGSTFSGYSGLILAAVFYNTQQTASQVAQSASYLANVAGQRGIARNYVNVDTQRQLFVCGDSIAWGLMASNSWVNQLTLSQTWRRYAAGIPGIQAKQVVLCNSAFQALAFAPGSPVTVFVVDYGPNDFIVASTHGPPYSTFISISQIVAGLLLTGANIVILPMLSLSNGTFNGLNGDQFKNLLNGLTSAAIWPAAVRVVPTSNYPDLCPDGSYANATFFNADDTHPTTAGQNEIATGTQGTINGITANPTYTAIPATPTISVTGFAGAATLTATGDRNAVAFEFQSSPDGIVWSSLLPSGGRPIVNNQFIDSSANPVPIFYRVRALGTLGNSNWSTAQKSNAWFINDQFSGSSTPLSQHTPNVGGPWISNFGSANDPISGGGVLAGSQAAVGGCKATLGANTSYTVSFTANNNQGTFWPTISLAGTDSVVGTIASNVKGSANTVELFDASVLKEGISVNTTGSHVYKYVVTPASIVCSVDGVVIFTYSSPSMTGGNVYITMQPQGSNPATISNFTVSVP